MLSWTASLPQPRSIPVCRRLDHLSMWTRWVEREPIQIEITIRHRRRGEGPTMRMPAGRSRVLCATGASCQSSSCPNSCNGAEAAAEWGVQPPIQLLSVVQASVHRTLHIRTDVCRNEHKQASRQAMSTCKTSFGAAAWPTSHWFLQRLGVSGKKLAPTRPRAPTRRVIGCVFPSAFFFFSSFNAPHPLLVVFASFLSRPKPFLVDRGMETKGLVGVNKCGTACSYLQSTVTLLHDQHV
ncbi:hypothetical protein LY76DRAFT_201860 [Colletotrichum caudatum]|nr:hypothetical protein LY76DRAFT_201860 [Colletotrichum caudatum]